MSKQRVRYSDLGYCQVGERAMVAPIDHPDTNLKGPWVSTSVVQNIVPSPRGPIFETENSLYCPVEDGFPVSSKAKSLVVEG